MLHATVFSPPAGWRLLFDGQCDTTHACEIQQWQQLRRVSADYRNGVTRAHLAGGQDSSRSCPCAVDVAMLQRKEQGGSSTIRLDNSSVGLTRVTNGDCESGRVHSLAFAREEEKRGWMRGRRLDRSSPSSEPPFLLPSFSVSRRHEIPRPSGDCSVPARRGSGQCNLRGIKDALYARRITNGRWWTPLWSWRKGPRVPPLEAARSPNTDDCPFARMIFLSPLCLLCMMHQVAQRTKQMSTVVIISLPRQLGQKCTRMRTCIC